MKLGVLFSGGKDSTYAMFLAKQQGYEISCLISLVSENESSYMFHTPSISKAEKQATVMNLPIIIQNTQGEKEKELEDLKKAIQDAIEKFQIEGIVTGAVESVYQASRIQKICHELNIECFNPLWQKDQFEILEELIKNNFKVIIVGVFAEPFTKEWLGRPIDKKFVEEIKILHKKYKINPAGEGGEFESFVLYCPLFKEQLLIKDKKISGEKNSWKMELDLR